MIPLGKCEVCGKDAVYHVTVRCEVAGPKKTKIKLVQFALCAECEKNNQVVFIRDNTLTSRIAKRLSEIEKPAWVRTWGVRW